ncbi:MAG: hypothetical protein IPJ77_12245 [Planctomycetes bacterium]|nr:hypothetical protein [Planctomycetota bacterium]
MLHRSLALVLASVVLSAVSRANGVASFNTLTEGNLGTLFTDGGITFSNPSNGLIGTVNFMCEDASGTFAGFPGFSAPNVLGMGGHVPGPGAGYPRFKSFEATTGQIEAVASVTAFLVSNNPGNQLILELWLGGAVVASTSYTVASAPLYQQVQLASYDVPYDHIVVRAQGPTDGGVVFACFDEVALYYTPPIPGGTPFCGGDGNDPTVTTPCPCGNVGAPRHGCANSVNANGAQLLTTGSLAADAVVLSASGMPATASCIFLQGDAMTDIVFGDGVRCAGGALLRLRTKTSVAGAAQFPDATDSARLSERGGVAVGSGVVRFYQTYYRNSAAAFCPPATFNVTNGAYVIW